MIDIQNSVGTNGDLELLSQIKVAIKNKKHLFEDIDFNTLTKHSDVYFNTITNKLFSINEPDENKEYFDQYQGFLLNINYKMGFEYSNDNNRIMKLNLQYQNLMDEKSIIDSMLTFISDMYEELLKKDDKIYTNYKILYNDLLILPLDFILSFTKQKKWNTMFLQEDMKKITQFFVNNKNKLIQENLFIDLLFSDLRSYDELIKDKILVNELSKKVISMNNIYKEFFKLLSYWLNDVNKVNQFKKYTDQNEFVTVLLKYFKNSYKKPIYNLKSSLILAIAELCDTVKESNDEMLVILDPTIPFTNQKKLKKFNILYDLKDYNALAGNTKLDKNTTNLGDAPIFVLKNDYEALKHLIAYTKNTLDENATSKNYTPNQIITFYERFENMIKNNKVTFIDEIDDVSNKEIIYI